MTDTSKTKASEIVADAIAPYTPRETARELADRIIAALADRFDLVPHEAGTVLQEVGK